MSRPSAAAPRLERALVIVFGAAAIAAVAGFLLWAQAGGSFVQAQSALTPWRTLGMLELTMEGRRWFAHFNLPLLSIGVWVVWLGGVMAVGEWLLRRVRVAGLGGAEAAAFGFALGFLAVGLALLAVGLAGGARPWVMRGAVASLGVIALLRARSLRALLRGCPSPLRLPWRANWPRNLAGLAGVAVLTCGFLYALTPPIQSDALRYHLGAPQEFLKAGRIVFLPLNAFSNFPFLPEMHFMLALGCGTPEASQLMHFATMCALIISGTGMIVRFAEPLAGGLCGAMPGLRAIVRGLPAIVVPGMPAAFLVGAWPFIDHAVALYFILSAHALLLALGTRSRFAFVLAGAMMGGALGCKYTATAFVAMLGVLGIAVWAVSPRRAGVKRLAFSDLMLCALVAAALGAPWYIKNIAFTGNPVYPLAWGMLGGGDWSAESAVFYAGKMSEKGIPKTLDNLPRVPFEATFDWLRFEAQNPGAMLLLVCALALGGIGCLAVRRDWRARPVYLSGAIALGYLALWFWSYQSNRMIVPFVMLLVPAAAAFIWAAAAWSRAAAAVLVAAALVACGYGALWSVQFASVKAMPPAAPYLAGAMTRAEYEGAALSSRRAVEELAQRMGERDRALFIGEHRIYGVPFTAVWSDWFDTPAFADLVRKNRVATVEEFTKVLRREGIGWVLYNGAELQPQAELWRSRFSSSEWELLNEVLESPAFERTMVPPGVTLMRLRAADELTTGAAR